MNMIEVLNGLNLTSACLFEFIFCNGKPSPNKLNESFSSNLIQALKAVGEPISNLAYFSREIWILES